MYVTIQAVALRTVKHNDRSSILMAWSAQTGPLSLLMPAGNGADSRRRRALTMPLSLFECVVDIRPGRDLHTARDIRPWSLHGAPVDVSSHPVRASVAMFMAEVLSVVTREGGVDAALWALVVETVHTLAVADGSRLAGLPVSFLVRLAAVSGIEPDESDYAPGYGLDLLEGIYRATRPLHDYWADPGQARLGWVYCRMSEGYAHVGALRLSRAVRTRLLDGVIGYFTLHHYPLDRLHSLDVLKMVMA